MKTFTRLFTLLVIAALSNFANAQTYDLNAIGVSTVSNGLEVPVEYPIIMTLDFENADTTDIPAGAQALVFFLNGTDTINSFVGTFTNGFSAGASTTVISEYFQLPATPTNVTLCGGIFLLSGESDTTNNLACFSYQVSTSTNVDLQANDITIVEPTNLDGFDIDNGTNTVPDIISMTATFENVGNVTYPAGYAISYRIGLDGDTLGVTGTLQSELLPAGTTTRNITNTAIIPAVPQDSGTYDVCVILNEDDEDASNDKACTSFTIIDGFDVFNPDNWPLGVEEEEVLVRDVDAFYTKGFINFKHVTTTTKVNVTDMTGRVVMERVIATDAKLQFNHPAGIYMINTVDGYNQAVSTKISVQ